MKLTKKFIKNQRDENWDEKQAVQDKKNCQKSIRAEQGWYSNCKKNLDVKKVQDVFDEVKEEKPINVENFFIDDKDIFDSEEVSNADREFIIDLINRTIFIANAKRFVEESNVPEMEIVYPEGKKLKRKNKCWLVTTKREKMWAKKIVWWKK